MCESKEEKQGVAAKVKQLLFVLTFCRYSILGSLVLLLIAPVARCVAPALLENGLLVDDWRQVTVLSFAAFAASAMLILQMRVTWLNIPDRILGWSASNAGTGSKSRNLDDYLQAATDRKPGWPKWIWSLWFAIPLPTLIMAVWLSCEDNDLVGWIAVGGLFVGMALCLLVLRLAMTLKYLIQPGAIPSRGVFPFESYVARGRKPILSSAEVTELPIGVATKAARWHIVCGPGYSFPDNKGVARPTPGHWELAILSALFLGVFLLLAQGGAHDGGTSPIPILAYLSLLVAIGTSFLSGLAFWLDRYHVSTLLLFLLLSFLLFQFPFSRDYVFAVRALEAKTEDSPDVEKAPLLIEVFDDREFPLVDPPPRDRWDEENQPAAEPSRTMIVVTAPGGGIHAAAWTAEVLTGLHEHFGDRFWDALGVVSAVSGGSVGAMIYLDRVRGYKNDELADGTLDDVLADIRERAQTSSLESAFRGAIYHDLLGVGHFLPGGIQDRGAEIENFWRRHLSQPNATLVSWGELTKEGKLPAVFFHGIEAKSGRRILFSPVVIRAGRDQLSGAEPLEFRALDNGRYDLPIVTAVRLSASFPYITPICRPDCPIRAQAPSKDGPSKTSPEVITRVGDGGYADNEGIVTAIDCIRALSEEYATKKPGDAERPLDRILWIRIRANPPVPVTGDSSLPMEPWAYAVVGPLLTLANVRVASQAERGEVEVDLLDRSVLFEQEAFMATQELVDASQESPDNLNSDAGAQDESPADWSQFDPRARELLAGRIKLMADQTDLKLEDRTTQLADQFWKGPSPRESNVRSALPLEEVYPPIQLKVVIVDFRPPSDERRRSDPPLNWKLSSRQRDMYADAWIEVVDKRKQRGSAMHDITKWLDPEQLTSPTPNP